MKRDEMLKFLEPIWEEKGWNFLVLKNKPLHVIRGIYMSYKNKTNIASREVKKEHYIQLRLPI